MHPSGNDSAAAQAVYQELYAHYLSAIPLQRTEILWSGPIFIAIFAVTLAAFFFLLAFTLRHVNAREGRLLELTAFAGHLTERVGRLARFSFYVWSAVVIWAAYFAIKHILFGMVY